MKTKSIIKKANHYLVLFLLFTAMLFSSVTAHAEANEKYPVKPLSKKEIKLLTEQESTERVELLEQRLLDISQVDLSYLSAKDKKALQKEVKDIQKELKTHVSVGLYIGGGTLLILILLLIFVF